MQQMAYMGYQGPQKTTVAPMFFANSVLPMVPGSKYNHWHVIREDFRAIVEDPADGDFLRDLENQTNYVVKSLREKGLVPTDHLPAYDDLWIASSPNKAEERTLHAWGHTKYGEAIPRLIKKGYIERRFAAPLITSVLFESPMTTVFLGFDGSPYFIVDDKDGNYQGADGSVHNAVEEGHTQKWMIHRQYLLCIEKIQAAQYALVFLEPPEPAKRWAAITRRRDPQKTTPPTPTDYTPNSVGDAPNIQPLQSSGQGGTLNPQESQQGQHLHYTAESAVRHDFVTNVLDGSADSNAEPVNYSTASWSIETLIGLAQSRHAPGLFECAGDDEDEEGAEKLEELRVSLGLDPVAFWVVLDRHIAAMMDKGSETWWACQRKGKNLRFGLAHVAAQWSTVEETLQRKSWRPLDGVAYFGPPMEDWQEQPSVPGAGSDEPQEAAQTALVVIGETHDAREGDEPPGETEESNMYIQQPTWPPRLRGMTAEECDELFVLIQWERPLISLGRQRLSDGSYAIAMEYAENKWLPIRNAEEWYGDPMISRAIPKAEAFGMQIKQIEEVHEA